MIYLDNAATTKPSTVAIAAAQGAFELFGNPSSLHQLGLDAQRELGRARAEIAGIIGAKPSEIYFTASGTEANNLAIFGGAKKHKGRRIVTTPHEHPSISEPLAKLAGSGNFDICHGGSEGEACLISLAHVNGETGEIRDLAAVRKSHPAALFHVDAAQSFCKIPINVSAEKIDLLTLSAHKIGGLKGVGALYVRTGINLSPYIYGGGQEGGLRSGTENSTGIMAFAAAAKDFWQNSAAHHTHVIRLKSSFLELMNIVDGITINGENTSPYILSFNIDGIKSHILLNALSAQGVYVSTGSACSTKKQHAKGNEALRVSFSPDNSLGEIAQAKDIFVNCIKMLRRN